MYMDKKQKGTVKDNVGAFFQTCKVTIKLSLLFYENIFNSDDILDFI